MVVPLKQHYSTKFPSLLFFSILYLSSIGPQYDQTFFFPYFSITYPVITLHKSEQHLCNKNGGEFIKHIHCGITEIHIINLLFSYFYLNFQLFQFFSFFEFSNISKHFLVKHNIQPYMYKQPMPAPNKSNYRN